MNTDRSFSGWELYNQLYEHRQNQRENNTKQQLFIYEYVHFTYAHISDFDVLSEMNNRFIQIFKYATVEVTEVPTSYVPPCMQYILVNLIFTAHDAWRPIIPLISY